MFGYLTVISVFVVLSSSDPIRVPTSWKDEQVFLPYYAVVDGLPSDKNVDAYYPLVASNSVLRDQVVQNDEVIRLFQKMNPNLNVIYPQVQNNPTHAAPNNNHHVYSHLVPNQNVNLHKEPAQVPSKNDKDTTGSTLSRNPEPFKISTVHHQSSGVAKDDKHTIGSTLNRNSEPFKISTDHHQSSNVAKDDKDAIGSTLSRNPEPFKISTDHHQSSDAAVNHENPGWIPTKPIYPGEGQWARKGIKHRPHITKNVFKSSPIDEGPSPGINFYNKQKSKFEDDRKNFPKKHKLLYPEEPTSKDEDYEETTPEEFVPYRTYAQVRRTESEKHVPRKKSQPRLRESVKDSKIHTIYTEEGYEDSAYDHGDLEKNAESTEDDNVKSSNKSQNSDEIGDDSEEVDPPNEPLSPLDYDESSSEEDSGEEEDPINEDIEENRNNTPLKSNSSDLPRKPLKTFENIEKIQEDRNGSESNNNDDIIIKFDSKRTKNSYNEEELIDSVMDESKFGKKIKQKKRMRRSAKIDTATQIDQKYPYYKAKNIDHLSSLRYAEISDNIPREIGGTMSFYENAEKVECPEMGDVDPVPDRVKNSENGAVPKNPEKQLPSPKLNNLGDHIDCLKARYFGDDPFDNPLFKEENIEQPSSIFKLTNLEEAARYNSGIESYQPPPVESGVENSVSNNSTEETLPEALPYVVRRVYRHPPPRYIKRNKTYSKPRRRSQQKRRKNITKPLTSTHQTNPKYFERISEVHYKDEIKPSEQMNVFADVINNIKNLSKEADVASSDVRPVTVKIHANKNIPHRKRYRHRTSTNVPTESRVAYQNEEESTTDSYSRFSTTNQPLYYTTDNSVYEEVPKRYRKRKPIVTTELEDIEEITERVKIKKRRIRPEYTYNGNDLPEVFSPAIRGGFKPTLEETISKETNHKPEYHELDMPVMNKYFYIGMRPPPEKPYSHPTFYLNNHIKRRRTNQPPRKRFARSARRGYADIRRGRQRQEEPKVDEAEKQDEEDDYVPHRVRNFHYDEKTGKIIYDKKPKEEKSEEEVEYDYIEVEEPTHPPPPKKEERRIWPTKYPDGPNYLDFVKKLKEDSTYVQILDPQPTEKPKEDASTTTVTSKVTSSTEIPEFLAILNKVRTDKSYKFIEDPAEKPNKTKTATPGNLEEKEELIDDASEEYIQEDVQNSPGLQGVLNSESQLQTSDASDSRQNPRNYNPRTSIDTSKYTSIQRRPTTRNRISSRYNSETIESRESVESSAKNERENEDELVSTTSLESFTIDIPTTSIPSTTPVRATERTVETTKAKRVLLSRRRSTTTASSSTESTTRATISRQRQRGRSRFSISSTTTEASIQEATRSRRNLQRRNYANSLVPRNHKQHYSEARTVHNIKPTPRSITVNLLKQTEFTKPPNDGNNLRIYENKAKSKDAEIGQNQELRDKNQRQESEAGIDVGAEKSVKPAGKTETKLDEVEIFQDYDQNQRHGGNYKYEKEQGQGNDTNSEKGDTSDINGRKLDDVDAFKDYDKNQKHGGNYKYKKVQIKITRNYRPYSKETREIDDGNREFSEQPQESQLYSSDSKLASRINDLKERNSDLVESHDYEENENSSTENENDFYDDMGVAHSRTKKEHIPKFIKDPSKRLYYYAPV